MKNAPDSKQYAEWLIFLGFLLFLLGLLLGFLVPLMTNPRMGLSAHLEGIMNGMFMIILGLIWSKLTLSDKWLSATYWLTIYGSFANVVAVSIGAFTGAGKMMPLAGGKEGSMIVEGIISFLLISLAIAMVLICVLVLSGLYKNLKRSDG